MGRRRNDDLDYMPTRGVRTDLKRFMNIFLAKNTVRYEIFSQVWRERNMSYLCAGRSTDREAREFLERALLIVQEYFLPPYQFQVRVGGLYLLYAMYQIQPVIPKVKIRMTPGQWQETLFFQQQAATQNHLDVVYIFHRLLQEQAFLFCYTCTEMSIHSTVKESEDREENLADSLKEEKTAVANLFNYESLEKLSYLQDQYQQMKIGLAGPQATKPDKSLDVVQAELVEDIVVFLQSFKEKVSALSRFGQRTETVKKPGEDETDNTGTRRQQLKVQAYSQLGASTNKRQKLNAISTSASPKKASKDHTTTTSGSPSKTSKGDSGDVFGSKMPILNRQIITLVDSSGDNSSDDSQDEDYLPTRGVMPSSLSSSKLEKSPHNKKVKESTSVSPPTAGNTQLESSPQDLNMPFIPGKDSSQTRISWNSDINPDKPVKRRGRPPQKYLNYSLITSFTNVIDKNSDQMGQTKPPVLVNNQQEPIKNKAKTKKALDKTKKVGRPPSKVFDMTGVKTITEIVVGPNTNKGRSAGSASFKGEMAQLGNAGSDGNKASGSDGNKASSMKSSNDHDTTVIHSITQRLVTPDMSLLHSNKQNLDAKNKENVSQDMVEVISESDEEAAPTNTSLVNKVAFKWKTSKDSLKSATLPSNKNLPDHHVAPVRKRGRPKKTASFFPADIAELVKSSAKAQKKHSEKKAKFELVYLPVGQHHANVKRFNPLSSLASGDACGQMLPSTARTTRWTSTFPQATDKQTVTMVVVGKEVGKPAVVQSQITVEKPGTYRQQPRRSYPKILASQPNYRLEAPASLVVSPGTKSDQQAAEGSTKLAEPSSKYQGRFSTESTSHHHSNSSSANPPLHIDPEDSSTNGMKRGQLANGSPTTRVSGHSMTRTIAQQHFVEMPPSNTNESIKLISEESSPKKHKQPEIQPSCLKNSSQKSLNQNNTPDKNKKVQKSLGKRKISEHKSSIQEQTSSIKEQTSSTKRQKIQKSAQNQKETVVLKLAGRGSLYRPVQKVAHKKVSENKEAHHKVSLTKGAHMKHSRRKH